jgi:hypothetical protein
LTSAKQTWPAAERNKQPILEVLRRYFPARGHVLEVASGSGQHAAFFAAQLPGLTWQPSELDPQLRASIAAWVEEAALPNLLAPRALDVCESDWGVGQVDAIFNANMIHIAPWECCLGLLAGAGRQLRAGGVLALYGPFRLNGAHTAPSNAEFDASLRARDARWGVRDCEEVVAQAERHGLTLEAREPMPANNQTLLLRRS